jgi:archaellum component FlaF (FlaF/FlaG flagellin family)
MKRAIGTMIFMMLVIGMMSPLAMAKPVENEINVAPSIVNVYTVPRYPIGGLWDTPSGTKGDIITVYAEIENGDAALLKTGFCNHVTCSMGDAWADMTNVGGNLWSFQLPGDYLQSWSVYEASSSEEDIYIYFQIYAEDADWVASYYPDFDGDNDDWDVPDDVIHIYPAWPPQQINATSALSKSTMFTGETFWVNGTSNYWNSTSHPKDFSKLLPADECPVTVKVNNVAVPGTWKTNIWGNYSVQATAPATPGSYTVNVTVSNATANRNVPCKSDEQQITVNAHTLALTLSLNKTVSTPGEQRWANGTVSLDGAPAGAGLQVNLSVNGTSWMATTVANGAYSSQFTAPETGVHIVNATVWHPTHKIKAWKTATLTVTETPVADLEVTADDISRTGILMEGLVQQFNVTVHNKGNAVATDARINITMDGALLNSTVHTIPDGVNVTIILNWTATPGNHNLTVFADPMNAIEEADDSNNNASNLFTITAHTIGITLGLNAANVPPGTPMWANGTVTMDGAVAAAGVQVNVSIGTAYWLVNTNAAGLYSAPFTASFMEGDYTVNATVIYPGYPAVTAWNTDDFTVAIPPFADLVVLNSNITVIGTLVNGTQHYINVAVRNIGTLATSNVQVNITIDGALMSSTRQNIGAGSQRLINFTWTATEGARNITVVVDPRNEIVEFSEDNNMAWKVITIAPSQTETEMVNIIIGPVLGEDGKPVSGATVKVSLASGTRSRAGEGPYTGTTNTTGHATISVPETFLGQSIEVEITKTGYEPVSFTGTLSTSGTLTSALPAIAETGTTDDDNGLGGYLLVIIIIIVIVILASGLFLRGRGAATVSEPEEALPPEPETPVAPEPAIAPVTDPRIAKLKQAYDEGRISKDMYEKNLAKFQAEPKGPAQ